MNENLLDSFRPQQLGHQALLDFCRPLPEEQLMTRGLGTFGDILETLHHIIGVDGSYVRRLVNSPPAR